MHRNNKRTHDRQHSIAAAKPVQRRLGQCASRQRLLAMGQCRSDGSSGDCVLGNASRQGRTSRFAPSPSPFAHKHSAATPGHSFYFVLTRRDASQAFDEKLGFLGISRVSTFHLFRFMFFCISICPLPPPARPPMLFSLILRIQLVLSSSPIKHHIRPYVKQKNKKTQFY